MPRDWTTSIIVPIFKKRDQEEASSYREVCCVWLIKFTLRQ